MTDQQKKTLRTVGLTLAVVLVAVLIGALVYSLTGNSTGAGAVTATAMAAAAEAARRRSATQQQVVEARDATKDTAEKVVELKSETDAAMRKEEARVGTETDEEKVRDGNDLFR